MCMTNLHTSALNDMQHKSCRLLKTSQNDVNSVLLGFKEYFINNDRIFS